MRALARTIALGAVIGCGGGSDTTVTDGGGGQGGGAGGGGVIGFVDSGAPQQPVGGMGGAGGAPPRPDAGAPDVTPSACMVEQQTHASQGGDHVASTASFMYDSNPPSSGPHCSQLSPYGYFQMAVDRCYWIHNLEHGAIALLYNCPMGCNDVITELQRLLADAPRDPDCANRRILITPYPMLDRKIAAAAWGRTWKADCLDAPARASLLKFIGDNLGSKGIAPEKNVCN